MRAFIEALKTRARNSSTVGGHQRHGSRQRPQPPGPFPAPHSHSRNKARLCPRHPAPLPPAGKIPPSHPGPAQKGPCLGSRAHPASASVRRSGEQIRRQGGLCSHGNSISQGPGGFRCSCPVLRGGTRPVGLCQARSAWSPLLSAPPPMPTLPMGLGPRSPLTRPGQRQTKHVSLRATKPVPAALVQTSLRATPRLLHWALQTAFIFFEFWLNSPFQPYPKGSAFRGSRKTPKIKHGFTVQNIMEMFTSTWPGPLVAGQCRPPHPP